MAEIIPFEPDPGNTGVEKMTMKKILFVAALMSVFSVAARESNSAVEDSTRVINLKEVSVVSYRATDKTPVAFTNVSANDLRMTNQGQDIPYLLSFTPSVLTTSDAGAGVGYTSIRVRGTDATRINITANGIPLNDAESHSVFWVNMPDFASSLKDIQIQRGAGTSTNGAGAFGASINMQTQSFVSNPGGEVNVSYGMFNTHKETVKLSTGLINDHWAFDARLSNIGTDGYIDRASVNQYSYFFQGGYFARNTSLKFISFGGTEKTYHAWNYASKEEMEKYGRTYNSCGEYVDDNGNTQYYKDQTDNYIQWNFQLLFEHRFTSALKLNAALHFTKGDGFYEEYKVGRTLVEYGLTPFVLNGEEIKKSDLIRKKQMDNKFGGGVISLNYRKGRFDSQFGGAVNHYDGWHFGNIAWIKNYVGTLLPNQEYYRNKAKKTDANIYARTNIDLFAGLNAFVDLQYRHINYTIDGNNDKYDYNNSTMQNLAIDDNFNFFNPKAGLNWKFAEHNRAYFSFSVAQKEPTRNNYTDGKVAQKPLAEKLYDYELGYSYSNSWLTAGANLYYMWYHNQLVLTGELNEIGEAMAANVPQSYRMGVELSAMVRPVRWFDWSINATLSRNRIKDFVEVLYEDEWTNPIEIQRGNTPIAFSPATILNNAFNFHYKGFEASLRSQYVSKQYMSNACHEEQVLDPYFVSNLHLSYSFKVKGVKNMNVGFSIYNLFNEKYENNGYAGGGYSVDSNGNKNPYYYAGYAAQAGTNVMGSLAITF